MAERQVSDKQLIEALLRERDELYRRAVKAERLCEQLSDANAMRLSYESRIGEMEASHHKQMSDMEASHHKQVSDMEADFQKQVSDMEADFQKQVSDMEADFQKQTSDMEADFQKKLSRKEDEIRVLVRKLEYMSRKLWGRMSEKRQTPDDPNQLKLDFQFEDLTEEETRLAEEAAKAVAEARKSVKVREHVKQVPVRHKLPENLRRVEEHVYPDGYLGNEQDWVLFEAVEISEHLEVTAPDIWVRVTVRHKAMRKSDSAIVTAPVPTEPLAKSYASTSLLTELIIGKYADHLPFYRQIGMYKRLGIELRQPTIEGWFHGVADLMRPMYCRLRDYMLALDYLQSDESTVPVIDSEKRRAVKGYMWLARSVIEPLVLFHYHEGSRAQKVVLQFFRDFKGALQVDGYAAYDILDKFDGVTVLCYWAHCRRYFERSLNHDKERAEYALDQIGMLYSIETLADGRHLDYGQRASLRRELSYPIIRALEAWALNEAGSVLPKSPIGKAIHYLLCHIRQLSRYVNDGRYKIDNNDIENSVRPLAVGRKGYLFCGNHDAAEDAAVIYTFMGCCKLANVDVRKWLGYFLSHIHDYDTDYSRDLSELFPHNLKKAGIL